MKYIFADFKCEIDPKYDYFKSKAGEYEACFDVPDFTFSVNDADIK